MTTFTEDDMKATYERGFSEGRSEGVRASRKWPIAVAIIAIALAGWCATVHVL